MKHTTAKLVSQLNKNRIPLYKRIPLNTPLVIYVEPSGFCNLKCKFCPHGSGTNIKKSIMSLDLFKKLVSDTAQFKTRIKLLRVCGNGDPLMNKQIVEIVKYAKESHLFENIELITNGTLLNDTLIRNLPLYLNRIIISIEGLNSDDYLRISNTKIDFDQLFNNIHSLYAHKKNCRIHIKINSAAIRNSKDKVVFFKMFENQCDEIFIENLIPLWPQYITDFSTRHHRFRKKVVHHQACVQIFKSLQIQADGDVLPCCVDWNRVNLLGNINTSSLISLWNGQILRSLQIKHLLGKKKTLKTCKDCTMNDYSDVDNIDNYRTQCLQHLLLKQTV